MIDFMDIFHSFILGIVEGITEFLPISSTAHLILAQKLLGLAETDFAKTFDIAIQFGAILSVVALYWKSLWNWNLLKKLAVAFVPTGILGLIFYNIVKTYLMGSTTAILWSLFLGGLFLIIFEKKHKENIEASDDVSVVTYKQAVALGLFQSIAMIPGVSRSAATIVGGLWMGLRRRTVVEFSFLLAVPTMLAATGLDLLKNYQSFTADQFGVLSVGFVVSFFVALTSIKFLLSYIRKYDFVPFGWYRIVISIFLFWLFW